MVIDKPPCPPVGGVAMRYIFILYFFNLSENPEGFKNKDFRYTLSLIYQTVEDEFEGVFLSPNAPTRNTDFFLVNNNDKLSFFVTPTNNFQYYLKSKGSLFRFKSEVMDDKVGYAMSLDLVMDYFGGFGNVVDIESLTPTFIYLNKADSTVCILHLFTASSRLDCKRCNELIFFPKILWHHEMVLLDNSYYRQYVVPSSL